MAKVKLNAIVNKDIPKLEDIQDLFGLAGQTVKPDVLKNVFDAFEVKLGGDKNELITDNREDLINMLGLTNKEDEINAFNIMRAIFRRIAHEKEKEINFSDKNLKSLTMDEICQLLGQKLNPSFAQIIKWILIIEEKEMDGNDLFKMKTDDLRELLKLTDGQKSKYEDLFCEMMGGQPQNPAGTNTTMHNACVGILAPGGSVKANSVTTNRYEDGNHKK